MATAFGKTCNNKGKVREKVAEEIDGQSLETIFVGRMQRRQLLVNRMAASGGYCKTGAIGESGEESKWSRTCRVGCVVEVGGVWCVWWLLVRDGGAATCLHRNRIGERPYLNGRA